MFWSLTFKSLMHFEFISLCGTRQESRFIPLHTGIQFHQHHLMNWTYSPHSISFASLSKNNWPYMCGFLWGLCILFPWSMGLFLCQDHTALITKALYDSLKTGSMMPPSLFFFLKTTLYTRALLWLHVNFRIVFFYFCEKSHWNFNRGGIDSLDCFGWYGHFNNLILFKSN